MSTTQTTSTSLDGCSVCDGLPVYNKRWALCKRCNDSIRQYAKRNALQFFAVVELRRAGHKPKQGRPRIEYSAESVRRALSGQKGAWNQTQSVCNGTLYTYKEAAFKAQRRYPYDPARRIEPKGKAKPWGKSAAVTRQTEHPPGMTYAPMAGAVDTTNSTLGGLHPTFSKTKRTK